MIRWISFFAWAAAAIVAALFLIANNQLVSISLDPFSWDDPAISTVALPLWMWLIAMLMIGFGLGSLGMWLSGRRRRAEARSSKKLVKELKKEVAGLRSRLPVDEAGGASLPVLQTETVS